MSWRLILIHRAVCYRDYILFSFSQSITPYPGRSLGFSGATQGPEPAGPGDRCGEEAVPSPLGEGYPSSRYPLQPTCCD